MSTTHTILLVQPTKKAEGRTYSDYESVNDCMEGVCRIYEEHLKKMNPSSSQITYDIAQVCSHSIRDPFVLPTTIMWINYSNLTLFISMEVVPLNSTLVPEHVISTKGPLLFSWAESARPNPSLPGAPARDFNKTQSLPHVMDSTCDEFWMLKRSESCVKVTCWIKGYSNRNTQISNL